MKEQEIYIGNDNDNPIKITSSQLGGMLYDSIIMEEVFNNSDLTLMVSNDYERLYFYLSYGNKSIDCLETVKIRNTTIHKPLILLPFKGKEKRSFAECKERWEGMGLYFMDFFNENNRIKIKLVCEGL